MAKNELKPSIQCNKCHKRIKYDRYYGYSHYCSGRVKDIYRAARKRLRSVNSLQNRDAQIFGMHNIADDLNSASVVYNPEADKRLRKEIEMKKTVTDLPTPEEVTRITATLDLANKLDNAAIAKLSNSKSKNSTPKIGELCGMDLLIDLSDAPEEAKYELYFKARTALEKIASE
nr:MAG TPA: hypothetical protein [Caudoviricetes sp.]